MIIRRYVQFVQKLTTSSNPVIWQLSHLASVTVRSTTGLNIENIRNEFGLDPLKDYKKTFHVEKAPIPADGIERMELLQYLQEIKSNEQNNFDCENIIAELDGLIWDVCTS